MIEKLVGKEKVVWTTVSAKVNEIIDFLNELEKNEAFTALLSNEKGGGGALDTPQKNEN